jgi:8-oxo-dGTP diphosphatase
MTRLHPAVAHVLELLQGTEPYDDIERSHIADALSWIETGINIYRIAKPDKPPKHLVSYFVLIDAEHNSLLLVDHIKAQLWLPSGGHVELNEDPKTTVIREAEEELRQTAVFITEQPFFVTVTQTVGLTAGHTDVSLWYLIRGSMHDHIDFSRDEFKDVQWCSFEKVLDANPAILDPNMQRFTEKLMKYLGAV